MKNSFTTIWMYLLAGFTTMGYIAFNFTFVLPGKLTDHTLPAGYIYIFWNPDSWMYWIPLAGISFIGNLVWGLKRSKSGSVDDPHTLPLVSHLSFIMGAFLMQFFALRYWHFLNTDLQF